MFEKVNPCHPDKVADRIAGAIVDLCYTKCKNPKVACEVLIGHGECTLQIETSEWLTAEELEAIVHRIAGEDIVVRALIVPQDVHLAERVAKRSGFKEYEAKAIMAAFAEIIQEETLESNRVSLCNTKGEKVVSIYPRVSGSISDKDVVADPERYEGKTKAEEAMLTPDMLQWSLGATIGIKFSKKFAIDKQAQKVSGKNLTVIDDEGETEQTNTNTGEQGGGSNPPSGELEG